ncbi:MAG: nuclear transport factor 2 family protein [Phenylobacterium sp.]
MTAPDDAIRARRRLTNKLIATHEALRLKPFFAPDARLIAGDGGLLLGADAIVEAFAGQFRDPAFIDYVRTPDGVELDEAGDRAAESGRWVAHWKTGDMSGTYLAVWRKAVGQWVIESELYVTLSGD